MTSSESDSHPPPRKRSRTDANGDETTGKKARGRPRVDTQDSSAADRRRTQIRLAQRAYRQRKETTISSLKNQNARLESIIDQMNKSFLQFNGAALKLGLLQLSPALAKEMKQVTASFVALAKSAAEGNEDGDDDNSLVDTTIDQAAEYQKASAISRSSRYAQQEQSIPVPQPQHTDIGWGYSATMEDTSSHSSSVSPPRFDISTHTPYFSSVAVSGSSESRVVPATSRLMAGQLIDQTSTQGYQASQQLPFGLIDLMPPDPGLFRAGTQSPFYRARVPTPTIRTPQTRVTTPPLLPSISTRSMPPDWTYSHDEVTFARRLTRAALESGFHMLSNAKQRPVVTNFIFKLTLPYVGLDALRDRFKVILSRGTDGELDCWETPFIHLGGAGTHYPKKDHLGKIVPIPNAWNIRPIGPYPKGWVRAENSVDPTLSHDLTIDLSGFEGEWFDAHDVEGYLEETSGCRINPRDSFAEVLVDVDELSRIRESETLNYSPEPVEHLGAISAREENPSNTDDRRSSASPNHGTPDQANVDVLSQETFGLDMGMGFSNDSLNVGEIDVSAMFDQPLGLDLAPIYDSTTSVPSRGLPDGSLGGSKIISASPSNTTADGLPIVKQKQKQAALLDVAKLINELLRHAVCLGRSPGFRRKDVDAAFKASLIHAY